MQHGVRGGRGGEGRGLRGGPTSCTFVSLSPLHTFCSMLAVGATVCIKRRGGGQSSGWSLAFSWCTEAHFVLVLLKAMAEEGRKVWLGHDTADLLRQELHLVLVRPHCWTAIGGELHHGEEGAEQVALSLAVIALHQLMISVQGKRG